MPLTRPRPAPAPPVTRRIRWLAALAGAPVLRLAIARYAVPPGSAPRAGCAGCGAPIGLDRPLRALSPLARCAACGARVGAPPGVVELALLAGLAVLLVLARPVVELAAIAWWLAWAVPLAFVDLLVHRLPDRLTYPAAAGSWLLLGLATLLDGGPGAGAWLRASLAGLGLALLFAATTVLLGRRGFGLGDAKLALGAGLLLGWSGWPVLVAGLLVAFLLSGLVGLALLATRRVGWSSHLPFGPFLILGAVAGLLLAG